MKCLTGYGFGFSEMGFELVSGFDWNIAPPTSIALTFFFFFFFREKGLIYMIVGGYGSGSIMLPFKHTHTHTLVGWGSKYI